MRRLQQIGAAAGIAVVALVLAACDDANAVRGSGTVASEERTVSGFDKVFLEGGGELIIDVAGVESLVIDAEDNLLPLLTSEVEGTTLELRASESISPTEPIVYTIGAASFEGISIAGSGDVQAINIDCSTFEVSVAGSGTFVLVGACDVLDLSISGDGDFDGEGLVVSTATVTINGSGDAVVNATDELRVQINGSGDVRYIGDPATDIDINGSGDVSQL